MVYVKHYHDNVRRIVRSITLYTPEELELELSTITYSILDTLTDPNNDKVISEHLGDYLVLLENEDEVEPDLYDALYDEYYWKIMYRLMYLLKTRYRINGGDYDVMTEDLYDKEVYGNED